MLKEIVVCFSRFHCLQHIVLSLCTYCQVVFQATQSDHPVLLGKVCAALWPVLSDSHVYAIEAIHAFNVLCAFRLRKPCNNC